MIKSKTVNLICGYYSYDPKRESLRDASRRCFSDHQIPFIENINAKDPSNEDALFAGTIGVRAVTHFNFRRYYDSERMMINATNAIDRGSKLAEEGKGSLSWDDANKISLLATQVSTGQYKSKKTALARSLQNVREAILEDYFTDRVPREALITAFVSNLL